MVVDPAIKGQMLALIIGVASGFFCYSIGMPLPWMLGPMFGNTLAALIKWPISAPEKLRPIVIPILGVMLGSAITYELFGQLGGWVVTFVLLPVFLIAASGVSYLTYRKLGRYDPVTAFYSSMPGGLNEMLIMGEAAGGNGRKIALAHAARVLFVIFFVALFFGLVLGVQSNAGGADWIPVTALTISDYFWLALAAVLGVALGRIARLPAAPVFGPMIISGAFHVVGLVEIAPPSILIIASQIVIGSIIGTRFVGATLAELRNDMILASIASGLMLLTGIAFAKGITLANDMALSQAFLAYAPGGLTEMSLLTIAMNQDVAYVSSVHIVRITLVIAVAPYVFAAVRQRLF